MACAADRHNRSSILARRHCRGFSVSMFFHDVLVLFHDFLLIFMNSGHTRNIKPNCRIAQRPSNIKCKKLALKIEQMPESDESIRILFV